MRERSRRLRVRGAYSLIEYKTLRDSITVYDNFNQSHVKLEEQTLLSWMNDVDNMAQKIFDYTLISRFGFRGGADIF
ncbi:MAG TPA: hypothetical protein VKR32_16055 [Puia sp.]|nr:hypothetical protein [Puia sp.]